MEPKMERSFESHELEQRAAAPEYGTPSAEVTEGERAHLLFDPNFKVTTADIEELELLINDTEFGATKKNKDTIIDVAPLYCQLSINDWAIIDHLAKLNDDDVAALIDNVRRIDDQTSELSEFARQSEHFDPSCTLLAYVKSFNPDADGATMREAYVSELARVSEREPSEWKQGLRTLADGIEAVSVRGTPELLHEYIGFIEELRDSLANKIEGNGHYAKDELVKKYCTRHGLDRHTLSGFRERVFPMIDESDPRVRPLIDGFNAFGTKRGLFGIADFTIHSLVLENRPKNVRDLMTIFRTIPTSEYCRFEANRVDSMKLSGALWYSSEFVHNELPGLNGLFEAMLNFYDTRNNPEQHAAAEEYLRKIVDERTDPLGNYRYSGEGFRGDECFNLSNYDKVIERVEIEDSDAEGGKKVVDVTAVDILRRLKENTQQLSLEKPIPSDIPGADELFEAIPVNKEDLEYGAVPVTISDISPVVEHINNYLWDNRGKQALSPNVVRALSYTMRMATHAVKNISRKDYYELGFDPGFREICKFSELTANGKAFDPHDFDRFWYTFSKRFNEDWPNNILSGYFHLNQRTAVRNAELRAIYRMERAPNYMIKTVGSGNLEHELLRLLSRADTLLEREP